MYTSACIRAGMHVLLIEDVVAVLMLHSYAANGTSIIVFVVISSNSTYTPLTCLILVTHTSPLKLTQCYNAILLNNTSAPSQ
jgi:hypothetical protein